jgi:hypothetical protein
MEVILSGVTGIIEKVSDDLRDNGIIKDNLLLFALHAFFYGAVCMYDFNFTCIALYNTGLINILSNKKPLDTYEKSLLIAATISLPFSYSTAKWMSMTDIGYLIYMNLACFIEPFFITEEHSLRKLIIRLVGFLVVGALTFFGIYYSLVSVSMQKYFFLVTCYLIASVCFQAYKFFTRIQESKTHNNEPNNNHRQK